MVLLLLLQSLSHKMTPSTSNINRHKRFGSINQCLLTLGVPRDKAYAKPKGHCVTSRVTIYDRYTATELLKMIKTYFRDSIKRHRDSESMMVKIILAKETATRFINNYHGG